MTAIRLMLSLHVWVAATITPLAVRWLSLRRLLAVATPPRRLRPYGALTAELVVETVLGRLQNPRNMRRRACLRRGLLLYHFLRLAGRPAVLHIDAVPGDAARPLAHCWVELEGGPVAEKLPEGMKGLVVCRSAVRAAPRNI